MVSTPDPGGSYGWLIMFWSYKLYSNKMSLFNPSLIIKMQARQPNKFMCLSLKVALIHLHQTLTQLLGAIMVAASIEFKPFTAF